MFKHILIVTILILKGRIRIFTKIFYNNILPTSLKCLDIYYCENIVQYRMLN